MVAETCCATEGTQGANASNKRIESSSGLNRKGITSLRHGTITGRGGEYICFRLFKCESRMGESDSARPAGGAPAAEAPSGEFPRGHPSHAAAARLRST